MAGKAAARSGRFAEMEDRPPKGLFPADFAPLIVVVADWVSRVDFDPEEDRNSSGDDSEADSEGPGAGTEHYVDVG